MSPWRFKLLGYDLGLAHPSYLLTLAVAALLGAWVAFAVVRRMGRLRHSFSPRLAPFVVPGVSVFRPLMQNGALTLALLFFGLALAQPQCGSSTELTKRRGIDLVVAIDASKSMLARDVQPSRLERAKLELTTLLDSLKGDRVAIVAFAGESFIQCPLTGDYAAAKMFLRAIDPNTMPQGGSDIGGALRTARQVLDNADRGTKDKVVVLISDGEDLGGDVSDGVDGLKEIGARVLAVGIGSEQGEPIPIVNQNGETVGYRKDDSGNTVLTRLDKAGLARIAADTGGELFYQPQAVAMNEVVQVIDKLQKSELESRLTVRYAEGFQPFVLAGIVFVLLAAFGGPWLRARTPKEQG